MVDALTDIDLAKGRSAQAIAGLERFRTRMPDNEVVVVNLGNAYLEGATTRSPSPSLDPLMPGSTTRTAWPGSLLSDAYRKGGQNDGPAHGTGGDPLPARGLPGGHRRTDRGARHHQ